jgi:predicted DNA-binding transcriptional regulator AlpA
MKQLNEIRATLTDPLLRAAYDDQLRREEAAASLGVSPTKFDEWVGDGRMPKGIKVDGVVLWDVQEISEAWDRLRDGRPLKNPFDRVVA